MVVWDGGVGAALELAAPSSESHFGVAMEPLGLRLSLL